MIAPQESIIVEEPGFFAIVWMIVTISLVLGGYVKFGQEYGLKKGGLYRSLQMRREYFQRLNSE